MFNYKCSSCGAKLDMDVINSAKFGSLNTEQAISAKSQKINKEILADATNN